MHGRSKPHLLAAPSASSSTAVTQARHQMKMRDRAPVSDGWVRPIACRTADGVRGTPALPANSADRLMLVQHIDNLDLRIWLLGTGLVGFASSGPSCRRFGAPAGMTLSGFS